MSKKIIFPENVKQAIIKILSLEFEGIRILSIISDSKYRWEAAELLIDSFYASKATIYSFEGFGIDDHDIEFLVKQKFHVICLTEKFSTWNHPTFKNSIELASYINEISPKTVVILIMDSDHKAPGDIKESIIILGKENLSIFHSEMKDLQEQM